MDTYIERHLKNRGYITRPGASSGAWMGFLLPTAICLIHSKQSQSSNLYLDFYGFILAIYVSTILSVFLLISSVCMNGGMFLVLCTAVALCISIFLQGGILWCFVLSLITLSSCHYGVLKLIRECPSSLTYGEAMIIVQSFILFIFCCIGNLHLRFINTATGCIHVATIILQVGFLGIMTICITSYSWLQLRHPIPFYTMSLVVLLGVVVPVLQFYLKTNPLMWIIDLVFSSLQTVLLVLYWIICCVLAIITLIFQTNITERASTTVRKYFHILAVFVFIPGLIFRCCLLYFSSGIILAFFIVLELMRLAEIPPLGDALGKAFLSFADEKDAGNLALTPMYLLAGCSLPMWLYPTACYIQHGKHFLALFSGILAVGVGDTAASIVGSKFGRHYWSGSKKTVEGTSACIISQLLVAQVLMIYGGIWSDVLQQVRLLVAVILTSVIEAKTDQVDNLSLPFITYIILMW